MSQELDQVQIKLNLSSEWFRLPPHVKIWLDDELIEDFEVSERKSREESRVIEFTRDVTDGMHKIKVQYLDKETPDTRIDNDGNIIADHLVNIERLEIDEIDLGHMTYNKSEFLPDRDCRPDLPERITEMVNLGYNGIWQMEFESPTYIWFLDNL